MAGLKLSIDDMADLDEIATNPDSQQVEIPHGQYEVRVADVELTKSKVKEDGSGGKDMIKIVFRILSAGEYEKKKLYTYWVIEEMWQFKKLVRFLGSLKPRDVDMSSKNFVTDGMLDVEKFGRIVEMVHEDITAQGLEYALDFKPNEKNPKFSDYVITEVFEPKSN